MGTKAQTGRHAVSIAPASPLTPSETQVVALLARNLSNKAIAARLDTTERTVKQHVSSAAAKHGGVPKASHAARVTLVLWYLTWCDCEELDAILDAALPPTVRTRLAATVREGRATAEAPDAG